MAAAAVVVFGVWAFVPGATRAATSPPVRAAQAQPLASYLNAVSCSSATFCVAVGYASDATTNRARTLIESWNGRRWSLVKSPNAAGSDYDELYALSCESPRFCVAVGRAHRGRTKVYQTLIESWNGSSWTIAHSFNTTAREDNILDGVSCPRVGSCVAVGYAADTRAGVYYTLVESWNGGSWKRVASPNVSAKDNSFLLAISCLSSGDCFAAGYHYKKRVHTLIEAWNGHRWSIVPSPNASATDRNILYSVSCASNTDCAVVGTHYRPVEGAVTNRTLIEVWNGHRWSLAQSPDTSATERNILNGVSCPPSGPCIAAGAYTSTRNGFNQALIVMGDSTWTIADSRNAKSPTGGEDNWLNAASCASRGSCIAVGYYTDAKGVTRTLSESWDGQRWTILTSPNA